MASRKRSLSDFHNAANTCQSSFVDDDRYRRTVLQLGLENDETEEDAEARLLDEARQLDIVSWDTDVPFSRLFEQDNAHTPAPTSSSASMRPPSTANASAAHIAASSSTFASSRDKIPSSRHSIISSSTCPTFCSCNERKPVRSRSEKSRARYSFDPSRLRSESRDGRLRFGLKHALSRLPSFKKRASLDFTSPARAFTCPECRSAIIPVNDTVSYEVPLDDASMQEWSSPTECPTITSTNEASVLRSLQSVELSNMRSVQESQKERHIAFKNEVVEQMKASHDILLKDQKKQNKKSEEEMSTKHAERAARIEENQLSAELTLVEDFKRDKQILQRRIRHMEAYFKTPTPDSEADFGANLDPNSSRRLYTLEERDRLRQKHHERNSMDTLHKSKIKVLRDSQTKRYEEAMRKMEKESIELAESNSQLYQDAETRCRDEERATLLWLETRQKRLTTKWTLEEAILRKKLELETNLLYGPLPPLHFEETQYSPTGHLEVVADTPKIPNGQ